MQTAHNDKPPPDACYHPDKPEGRSHPAGSEHTDVFPKAHLSFVPGSVNSSTQAAH